MSFTKNDLLRLQGANLPPLAGADLLKGIETLTEDDRQKVDTYFANYVKPDTMGHCVCCGAAMGGAMTMSGCVWEYDFTHGDGHCGGCGYPGRTVHKVDGVLTLSNLILQYHPSTITWKGIENHESDE